MNLTTTVSFQIFHNLLFVNHPTIRTVTLYTYLDGGWDSSVDIATHYGLDGPEIESRWGRRFSLPSRPTPRHTHHHRQFLSSLSGHRASTKHRHLVLFPAILLTSFQLFPFSNASLLTILRHVCLGLPLLLFPCGFQSKASLSMA